MNRSCFIISLLLLGCTDGRLNLSLDQRATQPQ